MKKYVILKKFNDNIWYATRNRYTREEVTAIADRLFGEDIDFAEVNAGGCSGLADGIIVVLDDGRKLNNDMTYLDDNLNRESDKTAGFVIIGLAGAVIGACLFGWLGAVIVAISMIAAALIDGKTMDGKKADTLPDDHETVGMMKGARL